MEFVAVAFLIIAIICLQNYIYTSFGLKNLDYECYFSKDEVVEGDEVELIEILTNRKILPLPWVKTEISTSKYLVFANAQSQITDQTRFVPSFFMLKSYSRVMRKWKLKCTRRGVFTIETVPIISTDLFGNRSISRGFDVHKSLIVLPKPLDNEDLAVSSRYFYGDIMVKRFILPDPFYRSGVRAYQDGDTMNKIHWNATAKQQTLMSYNNEYTSSQNVTVILNMQSHEFERAEVTKRDAMENGIRICASLFDNTYKQGMPIRFMSNSNSDNGREHTETPEFFGQEHTINLLHLLSSLKLQATRKFSAYLEEVNNKITSTDVVIVTCFINEEMIDFARVKEQQGIHVKFIAVRVIVEEFLNSGVDIVCLADSFKEKGEEL